MSSVIYGYLPDGSPVYRHRLCNRRGMCVSVIDYGATITAIDIPDAIGKSVNVVLGYDSLEGYLQGTSYIGALVGRVANRIANARFELEGQQYQLAANNGPNHLHGGVTGFNQRLWRAHKNIGQDYEELVLQLTSPAGDQGYPAELALEVVYRLTEDSELQIHYGASCANGSTPVNLTQHSYFNLTGVPSRSVHNHRLQLFCDYYTPVNEEGIPTAELAPVQGSELDFSTARSLADFLPSGRADTGKNTGVDHNFVVRGQDKKLVKVAELRDLQSVRSMQVLTTQPGIQVYTGNYLHEDGAKNIAPFRRFAGVCLECQGFPNAVNQASFPSVIVSAEKPYREKTVYRFSF